MEDKELCQKVWRALGRRGYDIKQGWGYCGVYAVLDKKYEPIPGRYTIRKWDEQKGWNRYGDPVYKTVTVTDGKAFLKSKGCKDIQNKGGYFEFTIDDSTFKTELAAERAAKRKAWEDKMNAIDLTPYIPTVKVYEKLKGYYEKGSKVNAGAIKDGVKMLTYYYASCTMGWGDLSYWINEATGLGSGWYYWEDDAGNRLETIKEAIDFRIDLDPAVALVQRDKTEQKLLDYGFKKLWQTLKDKDIKLDRFTSVSTKAAECYKDRTNGCAWTVAYEIEANGRKVRFCEITNEGVDSPSYGWFISVDGLCFPETGKRECEENIMSRLGLAA